MKELLIRCFYNEMSVAEAIQFIESGYGKKVSSRSINAAKKEIKYCMNEEWK